MAMLCSNTRFEGRSATVTHEPETATLMRSVAPQDRLNVANPYGIGQETVHPAMPPSLPGELSLQPTTSGPPATTAMASARRRGTFIRRGFIRRATTNRYRLKGGRPSCRVGMQGRNQ